MSRARAWRSLSPRLSPLPVSSAALTLSAARPATSARWSTISATAWAACSRARRATRQRRHPKKMRSGRRRLRPPCSRRPKRACAAPPSGRSSARCNWLVRARICTCPPARTSRPRSWRKRANTSQRARRVRRVWLACEARSECSARALSPRASRARRSSRPLAVRRQPLGMS